MNDGRARAHPIDPLTTSRAITDAYFNTSLTAVNDHQIRMSVMTAPFRWHHHPDSDETFVGVDGALVIEFADHEVTVGPGQMITVPKGVLHRTRPLGGRSVNLAVERVGATTLFQDQPG